MAANLNQYNTVTHSFDHLPQRSSIPTENGMHETNEDDRWKFQDTVPFDDFDLVDDQPGNPDLETQVLYDSDYDNHSTDKRAFEQCCEEEEEDEEMVLDSDDEAINGSRVVIIAKSSSRVTLAEKPAKDEPLETNVKPYYNGNGFLSKDLANQMNICDPLECGIKIAIPNENISIQDSQEWSQTDALDFVDRFVSRNRFDSSQENSKNRKSFGHKSHTVLVANGPRNLARKIYKRTQAKGHGQFDWFDHETMKNSEKELNSISSPRDSERSGATCLDEKTAVGRDCLELGFVASNRKGKIETNEVSEASIAVDESELERSQLEDCDNVKDSFDTYDIGINTQLAAEAIEALAHAVPFGNEKGADVAEKDSQPNSISLQMSSCKDIGDVLLSAKRKKRSERKFSRGISSSSKEKPGPENINLDSKTMGSMRRRKLLYETQSCCGGSNSNESLGKSPHKPIKQSSARVLESSVMATDLPPKGKFDKVYSRTRRRTQTNSDVCLKSVEDHTNSHKEKIKDNVENSIIVYRRKRSRVNAKPILGISVGENKLCDPSEEASKRSLMGFPRQGMWIYPKRKRSKRKVEQHSYGTDYLNSPKCSHFLDNMSGKSSKTQNSLGNCLDKLDSRKSNSENGSLTKCTLCRDLDFTQLAVASIVSVGKSAYLATVGFNCTSRNNHSRSHNKDNSKPSFLSKLSHPDRIPEFESKNTRRRKDITDVRVLLSQHLDSDTIKLQKKIAARLGIRAVSCCTEATHFIADEFARTKNMLEAIALGKPVVTHLWLESCGQANCFIDERNYILRDSKKEKEIGFSMPVSLARAIQRPLLAGRRVLVTPNVKPKKEMVMNLIEAVTGQVVIDEDDPEILILSSEEDRQICQPFLLRGASVYSSELLLNGIITQKLEFKRHRLFGNDIKRSCF